MASDPCWCSDVQDSSEDVQPPRAHQHHHGAGVGEGRGRERPLLRLLLRTRPPPAPVKSGLTCDSAGTLRRQK